MCSRVPRRASSDTREAKSPPSSARAAGSSTESELAASSSRKPLADLAPRTADDDVVVTEARERAGAVHEQP